MSIDVKFNLIFIKCFIFGKSWINPCCSMFVQSAKCKDSRDMILGLTNVVTFDVYGLDKCWEECKESKEN